MRILYLVTKAKSTSIPIEIAIKIDESTNIDVSIVSFYDNSLDNVDPDILSTDTKIYTLGASSRLDTSAYRQLRSLLADFDILHTHPNSVGSFGRIAALGKDVKIINTEHNDHRHFSHLQNLINCPTYPLIDTIITNSQSTQRSFRLYERPFLFSSKVKTVYNGVNFSRIDNSLTRTDLPSLPGGRKIVTAAAITEQKNLVTLVDAMEQVLQSFPESELVIIGDGPQRLDIEKRAKELSIEESTTFLGYLPEREQVYGTVAKCDIFAVPSIYEGFCNAAVEAMGCGLPIVASDIDVLREVIGDGGRFADPDESKEFAEEIQALLQDDTARSDLGDTARRRARKMFPIDNTVQEYIGLYQSTTGL